jgi:uncharacterized protein YkwD
LGFLRNAAVTAEPVLDRTGAVTGSCDNPCMKKIVRALGSASNRIARSVPAVGLAAFLVASSVLTAHALIAAASIVPGDAPIKIALVNPRPKILVGDAQALADAVNFERAKHHLPALRRDATLDQVAYAKAVDMAAHGYFGHTDPNGVTFADRMQARHLNVYASENIAFDASERAAQTAFVQSPDHYSSQIDPRVQNIGVAVVTVGNGQTFYVEDFSGK